MTLGSDPTYRTIGDLVNRSCVVAGPVFLACASSSMQSTCLSGFSGLPIGLPAIGSLARQGLLVHEVDSPLAAWRPRLGNRPRFQSLSLESFQDFRQHSTELIRTVVLITAIMHEDDILSLDSR
jgi:hypothetical protein